MEKGAGFFKVLLGNIEGPFLLLVLSFAVGLLGFFYLCSHCFFFIAWRWGGSWGGFFVLYGAGFLPSTFFLSVGLQRVSWLGVGRGLGVGAEVFLSGFFLTITSTVLFFSHIPLKAITSRRMDPCPNCMNLFTITVSSFLAAFIACHTCR